MRFKETLDASDADQIRVLKPKKPVKMELDTFTLKRRKQSWSKILIFQVFSKFDMGSKF